MRAEQAHRPGQAPFRGRFDRQVVRAGPQEAGHVFHGGYWVTRDELNSIQGLVKYKGRWISAEERGQREAEDKLLAVKHEWVQRIKILGQSILSSSTDRRREAESQLMAIREAEAVGALLRILGNDEEPMRILLSQVSRSFPRNRRRSVW